MAAIMPPQYVPQPGHGPRRYGLFNAANLLDLDNHGTLGGVEWQPTDCGNVTLYTAECPITDQDPKTFQDDTAPQRSAPFFAYSSVVCSPVGRTPEEQSARAQRRLLANEQHAVERALWDGGAVGAAPSLTNAGAVTLTPAGITQFHARIALLEEVFHDAYGNAGTIHVNLIAYGAAARSRMLREIGTPTLASPVPTLLTTPIGSKWSFGAGYGATGPAGVAPAAGSVYAFITPDVTVWQAPRLTAPDPAQTMNRITNQMTAEAFRAYAVGYSCPIVLAIEVPVTGP